MSKKFSKVHPVAKGTNSFPFESDDCTVRALTNALELNYADVHAELKSNGRIDGKPCHVKVFKPVYEKYNMKLIACFGSTNGAMYYSSVYKTKHMQGITVERLLNHLSEGRFIIETRSHVFAVVDGDVIDSYVLAGSKSVVALWKFNGDSIS